MKQLTPMDAIFLSMETPTTPATIGGLTLLDPSSHPDFGFDRLQEVVGSRLALSPRFTWRVQEVPLGLDLPYWVEDERFDLGQHVRRVALPAPGGTAELNELAAYLFSRPLDRSRPLWEAWLIEGLENDRVALLIKTHHCLMDGESGAGLAELLCDLEPEPAERPLLPTDHTARVGPAASWQEVASQGIANAARRPLKSLKHVQRFATSAFVARKQKGALPLGTAPRVSFNGAIGEARSIATTSLCFSEIKDLKKHFDVTINDVVLAITGGAVRRYLRERLELPGSPLVALVPMSTRSKGDDSVGNQITDAAVSWATNRSDPVERLMAIHESAKQAKSHSRSTGANLMNALGDMLPPGLMGLLTRAAQNDGMPLPANAVVSNVKGAPIPLYVAGARIDRMWPISLLAPTQGLNFTVVSYCGEVHVGITVDPDLVPEPGRFVDGIHESLRELQEAAQQRLRDAG